MFSLLDTHLKGSWIIRYTKEQEATLAPQAKINKAKKRRNITDSQLQIAVPCGTAH